MKISKNRKALDYGALMILVVAVSSLYLSYAILVKSSEIHTSIGEFATGIYKTSQEADKILFYIDESANLASTKAVYDLAKNGGFADNNCGKNGDYYLLNKQDVPSELCDKRIQENYLFYFNDDFKKYLKNNEIIPENNYDFFIEEKELRGIAAENLFFDIKLPKTEDKVGKYSVKPSFKVLLEKDLSDYEKINSIAKQILSNCLEVDKQNECVKTNSQVLNFKKEGDVFLFEYNTGFKSKFEKEDLKIKFALKLPLIPLDVPEA